MRNNRIHRGPTFKRGFYWDTIGIKAAFGEARRFTRVTIWMESIQIEYGIEDEKIDR